MKVEYRSRAAERDLRFARRERGRCEQGRASAPRTCRRPATREAAFAAAEVTLDAKYGTPPQHHNPIELFTTTCVWRDGELTIFEPSQFVYGLKNGACPGARPIAADKVHVVSPFVGGAFGSKAQVSPRTPLVALAAKKLNRPVKLVMSRDQGFTVSTYRAETRHTHPHGRGAVRQDHELHPRRRWR